MGTDGFEFIEYAAPDPAAMGALFEQMGFRAVARHRHKRVTLYRQGEVNFVLNAEPDSFAQRFARLHGPSICAIAFRVQDAAVAYRRALELDRTRTALSDVLLGRDAGKEEHDALPELVELDLEVPVVAVGHRRQKGQHRRTPDDAERGQAEAELVPPEAAQGGDGEVAQQRITPCAA